jgi:hypothetical protein
MSPSTASSAQLRIVNRCTCAWVAAGACPCWMSSHCTGVPVSSRVIHTATPRDASHSQCSSTTAAYQPRTDPVSRNRPRRAAAANRAAPRIAVHSPCPSGARMPRSTSVSTRFGSESPLAVNSALKA